MGRIEEERKLAAEAITASREEEARITKDNAKRKEDEKIAGKKAIEHERNAKVVLLPVI